MAIGQAGWRARECPKPLTVEDIRLWPISRLRRIQTVRDASRDANLSGDQPAWSGIGAEAARPHRRRHPGERECGPDGDLFGCGRSLRHLVAGRHAGLAVATGNGIS